MGQFSRGVCEEVSVDMSAGKKKSDHGRNDCNNHPAEQRPERNEENLKTENASDALAPSAAGTSQTVPNCMPGHRNKNTSVKKDGCLRRIGCVGGCAILMSLITVFSVLALLTVVFLPAGVEKQVNRLLAEMSENGAMNMVVKRIGLFRTDLSFDVVRNNPVAANDPVPRGNDSVMTVESCTIAYHPLALLRGRIDSVRLRGVNILAEMDSGTPAIPFLQVLKTRSSDLAEGDQESTDPPQEALKAGTENAAVLPDLEKTIPFELGLLSVQGNVSLRLGKEMAVLPFEWEAFPDREKGWNRIAFDGKISISGNRLSLNGVCDLPAGTVSGRAGAAVDTDFLPYALRGTLPRELHGSLNFGSEYVYDLNRNRILSFSGGGALDLKMDAGVWSVNCRPEFSFDGNEERVSFSLAGFSGRWQEMDLALDSLQLHCLPSGKALEGEGVFRIGENAPFKASCSLRGEQDGLWKFHLALPGTGKGQGSAGASSSTVPPLREILLPGIRLSCTAPELRLDAEFGAGKEIRFRAEGTSGALTVNTDFAQIQAGSLALTAEGTPEKFTGRFAMKNCLIAAEGVGAEISLPETVLETAFSEQLFRSRLSCVSASAALPSQKLSVNGISLDFPFVWPSPAEGKTAETGSVKIGDVLYDGKSAGLLEAEIAFENEHLLLTGKGSALSLHFDFASDCAPFAPGGLTVSSTLNFPEQSFTNTLGLAAFLPALEEFGADLSGKMSLSAQYDITPSGSFGTASFRLKDGELLMKKNNLSVSGLRISFELPRLPELVSRANQSISFRELKCDQVKMDSAFIRYRMESPSVWYLESALMNWCGGKVRLESTRLAPDSRRTPITLHCDRVDLIQFLEQLGVLQSGTGTGGRISGTIPVVLRNGEIIFRDGFLYSTPGEEGSVKLLLSKTISENAAADASFQMTEDALRDFIYSWARIQVDSEAGLLKLKLQLNGKPAKPLYYEHNGQTFVKTTIPHNYQGFQLDLNVSLPLSETLRIMNNLNSHLQ